MQGIDDNKVKVIIVAIWLFLNHYERWMNSRNGKKKMMKKCVKIHFAVDRSNGKILVGLCSKGWKHEHTFGLKIVKPLRKSCSKHRKTIDAEMLDSVYLSKMMTDEIEKSKAMPYIKIKKNSTVRSKSSSSWKRNIRFQKDHPEVFMKEFCYRVVIEGILSAFKKMFGSVISSKKKHNQNVEVLCRFIVWNWTHKPLKNEVTGKSGKTKNIYMCK